MEMTAVSARARVARRFRWLAAGAMVAVAGLGAAPCLAQNKPNKAITAETLTDADVRDAMQKGIEFLLKSRKDDNWQTKIKYVTGENCGETALVLYSLLEVGHALKDERLSHMGELKGAVQWLMNQQPDGSYSIALHTIAMAQLPDKPEYRKVLERNKALLMSTHRFAVVAGKDKKSTSVPGGVTYDRWNVKGVQKEPDASHVQYATLAAWYLGEFGKSGIELPASYWPMMDRFWRVHQHNDGGWDYWFKKDGKTHRDTNSAAGLATMFLTLEASDLKPTLTPFADKCIDDAIAYTTRNYQPKSTNTYYLFNLERVGLAAGLKYFGTVDWYRQGVLTLVQNQNGDGSWDAKFDHGNKNMGTAYALLFLSRGRHPVLFNKLAYEGPWHARPRDAAFLTRKMEKVFETPINWQVVNLKVEATDWLDAPVLLITGSQDPKFTDADIEKLRTFINAGGIVFSTADGDRAEFTDAMRKAAGKVVKNKYELRQLPKDHAVYSEKLYAKVPNPPAMWGMSNGVRDLWFHSPTDMGASWQGRKYAATANWDIATNVAFYASGKQSLQSKLTTVAVQPSKEPAVRKITVGRLNFGDNWDPEPGAWARMTRLATHFQTEVTLKEVAIAGPLNPKETPLIHFTGTTRFPLNQADADLMKRYLEDGGMLYADAAGGSEAFHQSFVKFYQMMYPDKALESISVGEPIVAGTMKGGEPIARPEWRKYFKLVHGNQRDVRLVGLKIDGRWAVVYSLDDLTSGLLGTQTWGIPGYAPETAQAITRNVLVYACDPKAPKEENKAQAELR